MNDAVAAARSVLAFDARPLEKLRRLSDADPQAALKDASVQFEALLLNRILRAMRESVLRSELIDSSRGRLYESLLDQQLAQSMASRGVGLAETLAQRIGRRWYSESDRAADDGGSLVDLSR